MRTKFTTIRSNWTYSHQTGQVPYRYGIWTRTALHRTYGEAGVQSLRHEPTVGTQKQTARACGKYGGVSWFSKSAESLRTIGDDRLGKGRRQQDVV